VDLAFFLLQFHALDFQRGLDSRRVRRSVSEVDLPPCRVSGAGITGWVVAVSLLAPFAVIELGEVVVFEDGSTTEAEIEPYGD
jgi:hypothetical protein